MTVRDSAERVSMSQTTTTEQTSESAEVTTAANIQRIDSGYFDHLQSLRDQILVGQYLVEEETNRWALISMGVMSFALLALFPVTMFYGFSYLVILAYLAAFILFGKLFYDRLMVPYEDIETWED